MEGGDNQRPHWLYLKLGLLSRRTQGCRLLIKMKASLMPPTLTLRPLDPYWVQLSACSEMQQLCNHYRTLNQHLQISLKKARSWVGFPGDSYPTFKEQISPVAQLFQRVERGNLPNWFNEASKTLITLNQFISSLASSSDGKGRLECKKENMQARLTINIETQKCETQC